jgi:hypothetical protein
MTNPVSTNLRDGAGPPQGVPQSPSGDGATYPSREGLTSHPVSTNLRDGAGPPQGVPQSPSREGLT